MMINIWYNQILEQLMLNSEAKGAIYVRPITHCDVKTHIIQCIDMIVFRHCKKRHLTA